MQIINEAKLLNIQRMIVNDWISIVINEMSQNMPFKGFYLEKNDLQGIRSGPIHDT